MTEDPWDLAEYGKELVRSGEFARIRPATGLTFNAFAGLLGTQGTHVRKWEAGAVRWIQQDTALKLAQMYMDFTSAQTWLADEGLTWDQLVPLRQAAARLGIASSVLKHRLTRQGIEPIDFGKLGEWIMVEEMRRCHR